MPVAARAYRMGCIFRVHVEKEIKPKMATNIPEISDIDVNEDKDRDDT